MDEINLLRDGIPTGVALFLAAVTLGALAAVVAAASARMPGNEKTLRITAGILCVIGLAISTYVAIEAAKGGIAQCFGDSGGCETVEKSKYSRIFGVHVSYFGLLGYLLIAGATFWRGDRARLAAFVLSLFGFGFSLYLTYLEIWELKAICQWCVGSAVMMTLLFIVNTTRLLKHYGLDDHEEPEGISSPDGLV